MKLKAITLTLFFLFIFSAELVAQVTIQGKVIDQVTREPLVAVNISVRDTNIGTATDENGLFELSLPSGISENPVLQIRFIGYIQNDIRLKEPDEFLTIEMQPDNIALNATGFGANQPVFFNPSLDRNAYLGVGIKYLTNQ